MKNVPTFFEEIKKKIKKKKKKWAKLFFLSFYGLTQISKLTIRVFLFLALRVKTSILSVRFFMANGKTKSWHCIKSEHNFVNKLNCSWIQLTMLYLNYGKIIF